MSTLRLGPRTFAPGQFAVMAIVRLVRPWNARSKTTTPARPVAARAILTAFSIASAPELTRIDLVSVSPGQTSSSRRQSSMYGS